ncbi:MAG: formate/nitrite transporter family protein [Acidimicrobiia bacterium]
MSRAVSSAFHRSVDDGGQRLTRSWPALFATGAVGGIDVGVGILGMLLVEDATGSALLGGLAFGIGFVALTLASSELFTENFLVPIVAVTAGKARPRAVVRLWAGTAATNLAGGWVIMAVIVAALPQVRDEAVRLASHYADLGLGWESFSAAVLGGTVITLMTWMQRGSDSEVGKLVAAVAAAFLLAAGSLFHAIVVSLLMFAGLQAGAPYGYADWLGVLAWSTLGNMVGGVGLVTMLRLVQVGRTQVEEARRESSTDDSGPAGGPEDGPVAGPADDGRRPAPVS